jgi:hypothetical protein
MSTMPDGLTLSDPHVIQYGNRHINFFYLIQTWRNEEGLRILAMLDFRLHHGRWAYGLHLHPELDF